MVWNIGLEYWLWVAYELNLEVCLMMHLSSEITILVCYQFFKQLRGRYGRRPIFTDGAYWYNTARRWLRLPPHQLYSTESKNIMERFIQHIKDRTECFDDHFPCRKPDCDRQHIWDNWLKLFVLYFHMDMYTMRFVIFLVMDGG
jgi:putative transposase